MASDPIVSSKGIINWDESWKELDLAFGLAINNDGSEVLLNPSDYDVTPHGGVQFADVALLGSDSANRVYAGFNNYIDARGGNDIIYSIDDYTGNQIIGGTGSDTFFLQTANNLILGGEIFGDPESHALSGHVGLADFEADAYFIDSSSESVVLSQFLKIYDFEVNRDSLSIDGLQIDVSDWTTARDLLSNNSIDINATPESTLKRITISLLEGASSEIDLGQYIIDSDDDELRVLKLNGPDWIAISGTVLTANTPIGTSENELKAIELQIGFTDEKVVVPFDVNLTLNNAPTSLELSDVITSLDENTDTSQPIKLADIVITDDALSTNIITLSGDDAAVFELSGNALVLKAGTSLDFESKSSYNININVADPDLTTSAPISTPFSLTLTDVNEPPNAARVSVTRNAQNNVTRFTITPPTGENTETLIVDPTTLEDGDQPIFEVQDGVSNSAPVKFSFNLIEESATPINLNRDRATEGGGTILSNAPSGIDFNFNGVYFNSAAGSDEITGSSFDDFIRAGAGDDIVDTGAGNDLIRSGAGNDIITTGDGEDLIYYTADQLDGTIDRVLDFSTSDRIVLGENIRASLSGNIATFITTIDGLDRLATLSFEGSSVVFDEIFITPI